LYVSHGLGDESDALKQALSLSRNNKAVLKILITGPRLPDSLGDYRKINEDALVRQLEESIKAARTALKMDEEAEDIAIEVESGEMPGIRIIRRVLRDAHDLVVKEAEPREGGKGFKAIDMELLRKCPCPVWLCRPIEHSRTEMRIAVAIDPESEEKAGYDLALRLLQTARFLADTCSGRLDIISCWNFEYEEYLRHNPWAKVPENQIAGAVVSAKSRNFRELDTLIKKSGIDGDVQSHHVKGRPEELIPSFVKNEKIDILVMGTVARTGIAGFTMGNTAENILQKLECSLLAMKPNGFVSPVKAY